MTSFDEETGRDRYFAAKDRELDALLDPDTGMLSERLSNHVACLLCGGSRHVPLFVKRGFTIVRCEDCGLVFANPQVDEARVLEAYRGEGSSELWVDVLTSERQLELDRAKFGRVLDELEPYRGSSRLLDVGASIGLFLSLARERGWEVAGTELGGKARAYAVERFDLVLLDSPLSEVEGEFDAVTLNSVLEHAPRPRELLREARARLAPAGALYLIVPNVESLACRVLHERAATFDGRNHLTYFAPRTLSTMLESEGFGVTMVRTSVPALDPVLEWLGYSAEGDPFLVWLEDNRSVLEDLMECAGLGYKLHCLANRA